ncbi:collagen alpha-2(I) chain-like [Haliotis asinina]|uniref:collagen alpha-2(I) chain-like n=1 Tax=Haliotis asinina TaxID=109174 RepID=UPI003531D697
MILLSFFICISIPLGATLPTGDPSQFTGSECRVYDEDNKCPPGHELIECGDKYAGLMRCSPCKENMYQCDFTTPEFSVTCQPPTCPDLGTETTYNVTYFENKTCHIYCLCNERNGYTGISGSRCTKHPPCGLNKELKNGTCVDCRPGFHNPNTDYGPCVAYETMTLLARSGQSHIFWILGFIILFIVASIIACWCWRGRSQACNIACCHSLAIQNGQQKQDAEAPENPPPYTPNDSLSSGTGSHQPNGIPPAPRNGIPGAGSNGIRGARTNGIPGARTNGIPGARTNGTNGIPDARTNGIPGARTNGTNGIPGARTNGIPGARTNGISGARTNGIPGARTNGIPGARTNGISGARTNGIPGARTNGISGARTNGIPGGRTNGIPGARINGIPDVPGNQVPHDSGSHSSISERPTPTGTGHPSTKSLASSPGPLTSQDNFLLSEPLTSEGASLNLQTQELTSTDPEQTGRKMPIPAQDIGTGSGDMNDETGEDGDDENQGLLGGAECGLVELDKDRDLSHVPLVQ